MRFAILLITLVVLSCHLHAQGTDWIRGKHDYREVLQLAVEKDKPACFVVYADWSRQSEILLNNVMTLNHVADFYNRHFINVKINAGAKHGRAFISRYKVGSIPAIVYITPDGQLLRIANNKGLVTDKAILKAARLALNDPDEKEWSYYRIKYETGQRDWSFLEQYIEERRMETGLPTPYNLVLEYINALPATALHNREDVRYLIYHHAHLNNELYGLMKTNPQTFAELHDTEQSILVFNAILHRNMHLVDNCTDGCKKQLLQDFGSMAYPALEYYELNHLLNSDNATAFINEYFNFIAKYNLPVTYNRQILMVVLKSEKVKKQHILLLLDELNKYTGQQEPSMIIKAIRVRLLIKAGYKENALVTARNSILGMNDFPRSKAEEHSFIYLQQVADGYINESFSRLMHYLK
ncbi:MAG: hypothetical protein MI866_24245 [Bacteroidales bacterium]|nr:hypothetical protein [Bacteroidales bacterium]